MFLLLLLPIIYKPKAEKIEQNPNRKKNRAKPEKNRTKLKKSSQTEEWELVGLNRFLF